MIHPGTLLRKDREVKKFVHASFAHVKQAVINKVKDISSTDATGHQHATSRAAVPAPPLVFPSPSSQELPHGLAKSSLADYSKEWSNYIKFALQHGDTVPGRDVDWDIDLVWEYLQFRAKTRKPETIKAVLTKLGHFGARPKFALATSRFDDDAYTYRSLTRMKRQLVLDARESAKDTGIAYEPVDRCTPVGQRGVSMILSAFELTSEAKFAALLV